MGNVSLAARVRQQAHAAAYLSLQTLRRKPLSRQMKQLAQWERLPWSQYDAVCRSRLLEVLGEARSHIPAYTRGPWSSARADDLTTWPILERAGVQERPDAFRVASARRVHLRKSSASTSHALRTAWDPAGASWMWAAEYRAIGWHGVPIASRTLMLWARHEPWVDRLLNRFYCNTANFTVAELERAARFLMRERPMLLWSMPSPAAQLARYIGVNYPDASRPLVQFAKIGGEQVYNFQRMEIERYLGATVIALYGCSEMGPIATECPLGSMHVIAPLTHIEIVRGDEPAKPGEFGDIVATSLVNKVMPLIRYRNGDRARLLPDRCPCGLPHPVMADLQGRHADVFEAADGRLVHGSALGKALQSFVGEPGLGAVRLMRFEQIDTRKWKLTVESDLEPDALMQSQAEKLVQSLFGKACKVSVSSVMFLPRETSGKFRYYRPAARVMQPIALTTPDELAQSA